ncbi:hypothetical protein L204_102249 [Cryptococcus depauperatus]
MQAVWSELGERVCALHDGHKVRWTSIDVVAFAEAGKRTFSLPLIWIGIEPGSLAYELVNTAAEAVHFLLTEAGFRESVITCSVDGPKMLSVGPFNHSVREYGKHFTPALGLSIAPLKTPHFEGTGALYLRESKDSKRVFLLTCAHVARPPPVNQNKGLASKTKSHPREKVIVHGRLGYRSVCTSMIRAIGNLDNSIRVWQAVLRPLGSEMGNRAIDQFRSEVVKRWSKPKHRVIGEVVHVEPIKVSVAPQRFSTDWALIELYDKKFDWDTFPGNKVHIGDNLSLDYGSTMFPQPEDRAKYGYPIDGLQALGGIQPEEINNPQQLDVNGEPCLLVVKNDRTTGTSIGRATGMESFIRIYKEYGIEETSKEIAVLPYNNKTGPFSAPGDSGSIVLDRNGRILGSYCNPCGDGEMSDGGVNFYDHDSHSTLSPPLQISSFLLLSGTIHNNLSENFLKSCEEVIHTLTFDSPVLPISTTYQVAQLKFDEDDEAYVSDAKRLSTFYANAAYDFYGTPSGALCVYKNGDAWPVRTGPESQRIIREARGVHGHPMLLRTMC